MIKEYRNIKRNKIDGFLVAFATANETGLPYDILLDSLGAEKKHPGCPRVGVVIGDIVVPVSISEEPIILSGYSFEGSDEICDWIGQYYIPLRMHWDNNLSDLEILTIITRA